MSFFHLHIIATMKHGSVNGSLGLIMKQFLICMLGLKPKFCFRFNYAYSVCVSSITFLQLMTQPVPEVL
jgi:hypothetical protein